MNGKTRRGGKRLSEAEIDREVVDHADDSSAWTRPVRVRRRKASLMSIPAPLAERAAFLARLHRESAVEEWLARIIRERIELEESAFAKARRELGARR